MPVRLFPRIVVQLLFLIVICYAEALADDSSVCIAANDFGLGGVFKIRANPDEGNSGPTKLLRTQPKKAQIAPWIDTELYASGNTLDNGGNLLAAITGSWNPWGMGGGSCKYLNCDPAKPHDAVCLPSGEIVDDSIENAPCIVADGYGLYGLIAILKDGVYQDPNKIENATSLPQTYFRTFNVTPLKKGDIRRPDIDSGAPEQKNKYEYHFEISQTQYCDTDSNCVPDTNPDGSPAVLEGRLFFKILDRYYQDNTGSYEINILSGVYSERGFIETTIKFFQDTILRVTDRIYQSITTDSNFINIVRALLLLYIISSSIGFMLGVLKMNQSELIIRIVKIGLVATLISEGSWEFFNKYLFTYFTEGAESIGIMIIKASLFSDEGIPNYILPKDATPLAVYDSLLKMLTMPPIHIKIAALLFYKWQLYWIPCIYICIFLILWAIFKSVVLYLLAIMQFALLLVAAPIFLIMMLFKITSSLFDAWLKNCIAVAILYLLISASIAMMMALIVNQITSLLGYEVCWQTVWELKLLWLTIFELKFWYPQSDTQVLDSINAINFFAFLVVCFLFKSFIESLPSFADMLSNAVRTPLISMYDNMIRSYNQSPLAGLGAKVRALNPIGMLLDRKGSVTRTGIDAISGIYGMGESIVDKIDDKLGYERREFGRRPIDDRFNDRDDSGPDNMHHASQQGQPQNNQDNASSNQSRDAQGAAEQNSNNNRGNAGGDEQDNGPGDARR